MQNVTIKTVKSGDYIKRKADSKTVYIKGDYIRSLKGFECADVSDMNKTIVIKSDKIVFVGFTY
jgi:small nuclear ribonucleoprotein (snRNP)-like protein